MTLRCVDNTLAHLHLAAEQNDGPAKTTLKGKPGAKTSSRSFLSQNVDDLQQNLREEHVEVSCCCCCRSCKTNPPDLTIQL